MRHGRDEVSADREQLSLRVGGGLDLPFLHALVVGGGEALAAILDPFDGRSSRIAAAGIASSSG
jgi:hypothetical protein